MVSESQMATNNNQQNPTSSISSSPAQPDPTPTTTPTQQPIQPTIQNNMFYAPPHKRISKDGEAGSSHNPPKPDLPPPCFNKNPELTSAQQQQEGVGYKYEHRWFAVGLDRTNHIPPSVHLQPVPVKSELRALINNDLPQQSSSRVTTESFTNSPWEYIAENVLQDLLSSFKDLRSNIIEGQNLDKKPLVIARFGKVLFCSSVNNQLEPETTNLLSEDTLRPLRSSFYTSIPDSYVEYITKEGASKGGLEFEEEKEVYLVSLSDNPKSDESIYCKCRALNDREKLDMYKIGHPYKRRMRRDISCLEKNLDLRLDLGTISLSIVLTDDDMKSIRDLIDSAIVDTQVKGGLRWPLGKEVSGKYSVTKVWHIIGKTYKNSSLRLKIRDVDRYEFKSSTGQAAREVLIMLKGLASELGKEQVDANLINEILKDDLKVLWNNFLCCERFPT